MTSRQYRSKPGPQQSGLEKIEGIYPFPVNPLQEPPPLPHQRKGKQRKVEGEDFLGALQRVIKRKRKGRGL